MPSAIERFKQQLKAAFREIPEGQVFTFRRTFTEGDVSLFCGVTGDYNPYHIDGLFARESRYKRRIVPGLLTASMITHIGGLLGFLAIEMHFQYIEPVFIGDTITCIVNMAEKNEKERLFRATAMFVNQDDKEVLKASFSGFPGLVRLKCTRHQ